MAVITVKVINRLQCKRCHRVFWETTRFEDLDYCCRAINTILLVEPCIQLVPQ